MTGVATAIVGVGLVNAYTSSQAAGDAAKALIEGTKLGIAEQRSARLAAEERLQPFADIGLEAGTQLQNLLADPSQGLEEINPIVSFLRDEGFEQIQESAAAGGRLGAGDTLKDLTRFNTNLGATIVPQLQNQRFNQLFNVLGQGQNAATGQATSALQTGANVSNLLGQAGTAQAQGIIGQQNALTGGLNTIASGIGAFNRPAAPLPVAQPAASPTPSLPAILGDF